MRVPYGLNIVDNCLTCTVREEHLFRNLSPMAVQKLSAIKFLAIYPKSTVLYMEANNRAESSCSAAGR